MQRLYFKKQVKGNKPLKESKNIDSVEYSRVILLELNKLHIIVDIM